MITGATCAIGVSIDIAAVKAVEGIGGAACGLLGIVAEGVVAISVLVDLKAIILCKSYRLRSEYKRNRILLRAKDYEQQIFNCRHDRDEFSARLNNNAKI